MSQPLAPGIDIDYNANTYNPNGSQTARHLRQGHLTNHCYGAHMLTLSVDNDAAVRLTNHFLAHCCIMKPYASLAFSATSGFIECTDHGAIRKMA